jgi:hypothetical protein
MDGWRRKVHSDAGVWGTADLHLDLDQHSGAKISPEKSIKTIKQIPPFGGFYLSALPCNDARGLGASRPFLNRKFDLLAFFQFQEPITLDGRVMDKNVTVIPVQANEAVSTLRIEPLYFALKSIWHVAAPKNLLAGISEQVKIYHDWRVMSINRFVSWLVDPRKYFAYS